jgi:AcrR family transcriptional regulator
MGAQTSEISAESAAASDGHQASVAPKPLRRDAERNRQLILQAARELFAERGLSATLDDVAAHAGVGVGTVYRRFADRDALVDALFTDRIAALVAAAEAALLVEDPWEGLVGFMRSHMQMQQDDRSFASVVMSDVHGRDALASAKESIQPLAARLVARAHEAGVIRSDLTFTDIPMLVMMFGTVLDATRDLAPEVWERYFAIVLDGIRASSTTPLPAESLTVDQVPLAMRNGFARRR